DLYQSTYLTDARIDTASATGRILMSTDNGASWSLLHDFGHPVVWVTIDPNNPSRMYASVVAGPTKDPNGTIGGIWVTNNLHLGTNSTWTKLSNPPRTQGHPYIIRVLNDGAL